MTPEPKNCETPCRCDTCYKARDEELNRARIALLQEVEEAVEKHKEDCDKCDSNTTGNEALDNFLCSLSLIKSRWLLGSKK